MLVMQILNTFDELFISNVDHYLLFYHIRLEGY